jgi:predicted transposase YdaD
MLDLRTADVTQTRFYQEVFQVGWQVGRQQGRQIGQEEERQVGRQEGETDLVLRQLIRRCGGLSPVREQQIRGLAIEQLEGLGDALLDFTGMLDLENWLKVHSGG